MPAAFEPPPRRASRTGRLHVAATVIAGRAAATVLGRLACVPTAAIPYVSECGPFVVDTSLAGNSNRGHEYGVTLSEEERAALLEYLKTL